MCLRILTLVLVLAGCSLPASAADAPLGGFVPFVGIGLTNEYDTFDDDEAGYLYADPSNSPGGSYLGSGFNDIALLDTGAAVHILTSSASGLSGFNIAGEGFSGTNPQAIYGATGGSVLTTIDDPLGIYAAGLGDRVSAGSSLIMDPNHFRGQTSVSVLEAGSDWKLPNVVGLPLAAQHGIKILNSQPQIFEHQGRTMRTPQVEFFDLGKGDEQGIARLAQLHLEPSASFTAGPFYFPSFEIDPNFNIAFHENPLSPTVIDSGGLYLDVDVENNGVVNENVRFLFDTGADLTVVSRFTALDLGFDALQDEPDFLIEVEGAGGVASGVPGIYVDHLVIDALGGSITLDNVPVVVLNVPNPLSPSNIIDAIIGMHVFAGRDLAIDAAPAATVPSVNGPALYISDPKTQAHQWSTMASTSDWGTAGNWLAAGDPNTLWIAQAANASGSNQTATVSANSTVFELQVSGSPGARMTVDVQSGVTLTTFGQSLIETGGEVHLDGGKLDSQVVNIEGGTLSGSGEIFVGTGPITGVVRNLSGRIEPEGLLTVTGDLSNLEDATIEIDLLSGGNDQIDVSRFAFLGGTLEVKLHSGFVPTAGQQFTLLTYGTGVDLDFSVLDLPLGFTWNLFDDEFDSVILEAVAVVQIPGDFDNNGYVDSADLDTWEAGYGAGGYTAQDFLTWQRFLGAGTPPSSIAAVPEPSSHLLVMLSLLFCCRKR